jgi:hypothetical protein
MKQFLLIVALTFAACQNKPTKVPEKSVKQEALKAPEPTNDVKTFYWTTAICRCQGDYNPEHYNMKQLSDTYYLWDKSGNFDFNDPIMSSNPTQLYHCIVDKYVEKLDRRYDSLKRRVEKLWLVEDKKWEDLRQSRLREMKDMYEMIRLITRAYCDPNVLLERSYGPECDYYANALISGDEATMEAWEKLVRKLMENNYYPQDVYDQYLTERSSGDSRFYARDYILKYGFYNCANSTIYNSRSSEIFYDDFEQLFTNYKEQCDEP